MAVTRTAIAHAHGTAVSQDFLEAISKASGRDVTQAFQTFLDQPGVRERIVSEIRKIYDGNIIWGEDLMEIPIKGPQMFRME